jgi:2-methylisocitrate lyase-like PEP mutase family enzyme
MNRLSYKKTSPSTYDALRALGAQARRAAPDQVTRELISRAKAYAESGADGLFVLGLVDADTIEAIARGTPLPLNVLLRPGLPPLDTLRDLGVRRLSTGPRLAAAAYGLARRAARGASHTAPTARSSRPTSPTPRPTRCSRGANRRNRSQSAETCRFL